MNNKLVEKLKWIRSEVLALKQAHEYGIGRADFPWTGQEVAIEDDSSGNVIIKVIFSDSVENMPYMQFYSKFGDYNWFSTATASWENHIYTIQNSFSSWTQPMPDTFYVVATMPIKDLEVEVNYV